MTFLLDTQVISALRRPERAALSVVEWVSRQPMETLWCSAISIFELELGVLRTLREDRAQGDIQRTWMDGQVLPGFAQRILPIDASVARRHASLQADMPRRDRDALIAATTLVHGLTLVTDNVRDFEPMGVKLFNPWMV